MKKYILNILIIFMCQPLLAQDNITTYPVSYGKHLRIITGEPVVNMVQDNNTWDIKLSPIGDGIFVWARDNSVPINLTILTADKKFIVNLELAPSGDHPDVIRPDEFIAPPIEEEVAQVSVAQDDIEQSVEVKADESTSNKENTESLDASEATIVEDQELAKVIVETQEEKKIVEPKPVVNTSMTIRDFANKLAKKEKLTLLELPGDEQLLDIEIENIDENATWLDIYSLTDRQAGHVVVNEQDATVRIIQHKVFNASE